MAKNRDVGIDLLKVLLALMVISVHFNAPATGHVASSVTNSAMMHLIGFFVALCYPAVNCYIIISGFFSYQIHKTYSGLFSSLLKLWFCLLFFSVFGYIVMVVIEVNSFSVSELIKRLFPISRGEWWFMSKYFLLMLLSPMINKFVDDQTKKEMFLVLAVSITLCSLIPFFMKFDDSMDVNNGGSVVWFMVLYYTGAFIQKYICVKKSKRNVLKYLLLFFVFTIAMGRINSFCSHVSFLNGYHVSMYNSVIVYGQAIMLFIAFWNLDLKNERLKGIILSLAGMSMASYVFHCQEDIGPFIWKTINPSAYCDTLMLIPVYIVTVLGLYVFAVMIEYARSKIVSFNNFEKKVIKSIISKAEEMVNLLMK